MSEDVEIITVDASNVDKEGFLCYKSKSKTEGYQRKRSWLKERFREGMTIKLLHLPQFPGPRGSFGFIEYTPGEYAWRPVNARNYLFIDCLWVIGQRKGKGYATRLLQGCLDHARRLGKDGVAMVSRSGGGWLAGKRILLTNGFELADHGPFKFDLFAKKCHEAPSPGFPTDWEQRATRYGAGLTIVHSSQCPYMTALVNATLKTARERGIRCHAVELKSAHEVQTNAPSPYGTYGAVYDGRLLAASPTGVDALLTLIGNQAS